MLTWDLKTDKVTPGQWLKYCVYSEGADLSPDGWHLIYNTATHNPGHAVASSYVAISKPPFFTAIALYPTPRLDEGGALDLNTDWADVWQGEVLCARNGCLFRMVPGDAPRLIADLNANSFRSLRAPYQGVEIARHRRKHWHPLEGA